MTGPFASRLLGLVATLLGVSLVVFLLLEVLPGDPAAIMLGTSARPDTLAALRHQMGLDVPAFARYAGWLAGFVKGDLGQSYAYGVPVSRLIAERFMVTAPLTVMALALVIGTALPLGAAAAASAAARRRRGWLDHIASAYAQIGIAVPNFWIGLLLILVVSLRFGWLPAGGFPGWSAGFWPAAQALILPAVALALPQSAVLTRVTRGAVLEVLDEDFVRTARAKGLSRSQALWRHAVPNALVPVVTVLGLQFSFLIAGAILVENVFNLPGMGRLAYQALAQRDVAVIKDVVMLFAATVIIVNWAVDLLYPRLDPRLAARP